MGIGKKLAHKADAIKGATKKLPVARPTSPGCAPKAAPDQAIANAKQAGAKVKDALKY